MADYSTAPTRQGSSELIPDGTLVKLFLRVQPFNLDQGLIVTPPKPPAKNSYLNCEVTIIEGEYERRKLFPNIMVGPEERARNMGNAQIRAILEYGANAGPQNPSGYVLAGEGEMAFMPWVKDGIMCAGKIKIKKPTEEEKKKGYDKDKNEIAAFLSPNPESDTYKDFLRLQKGETAPATKTAAAPAGKPDWSTKPAAPAPASTGQPAAAGWASSVPAPAAAQPAAAASPALGQPGYKPSWMPK